MVEQLSFGSSIPKMSSCLGLFLSPETIFLAEVEFSGGKPRVRHLIRLPVPAAPPSKETKSAGSLNTDFLADTDRVAGILKKAMDEVKWGSKFVVASFSHHFSILRYFTLPAIDRRFWKTAIPAEAKKYIPIPFNTLSQDYQVFPAPTGADKRPRLGVLFGVTPQKNMESLKALTARLELTLVATELAPVCVERLWDSVEPAPSYAQVHFDGSDVRILISEEGKPIFFRELFLGEGATAADLRKVDLRGSIDYTKKQLGSKGPGNIRLSGQMPDLESWRAAFSQDLGAQAGVLEVDKALGLKAGHWGAYAALGGALRHLAPTPLTMDLSGVGRISDEDRRAAFTLFVLSGVAAGALLLVGGVRFARVNMLQGRLSSLRRQEGVLDEFRGKTKAEIEASISRMRDKVNSFGSVTTRQMPLARILQALAETIPEAVWMTDLNYVNQLNLSEKKNPRLLSIGGNAFAPSAAAEQDLAFRFADALRGHKQFNAAFPSIDPSVEKKEGEAGGAAAQQKGEAKSAEEEDSAETAMEKRTHFILKCASSRQM